ncbi:MAG TPA: phospho-N-acetylmuramoyl-pentapeptide-transferase [Planctomycetaceae bacterium]|nr:phospho-N-acetylmuramoyl-pentapeptide-transferase [Planctomycetaceae bacterium]
MLYWLFQQQRVLDRVAAGETAVYLTARTALAAVAAFVLAWWFGPVAIAWLKSRFRERIDSASARLNELHAAKNATPTMGGLFIVGAVVLSALLFGDLGSPYVLQAIGLVITCGSLGAVDDWIKIRTAKRGLTARQKLAGQLVIAAAVVAWLYVVQLGKPRGLDLVVPFGGLTVSLGLWLIPWGTLVVVGSSNGVNLTDGLDGLAGGCLVFAGAAMCGLCYLAGHRVMAEYLSIPYIAGAGELCILFGALVGAMLGFLWYNCYPAEVFMGDTGSLPAGALLGFGALVARQELLLLVIGGVFVIETLSVILQVSWFRWTGKRLIACSPLHNHYLFRGDHEIKIVVRFWIGSALLALLAVASLKIR